MQAKTMNGFYGIMISSYADKLGQDDECDWSPIIANNNVASQHKLKNSVY